MTVTYKYTLRPYQRAPRYEPGTETVEVSDEEIEAEYGASGVPADASREDLAQYVASSKRDSRAWGRLCMVSVS